MKPLVMLHGWGASPAVWAALRAALAQPLLCPALPGHGRTAAPGDKLADWCAALAADLPDGAVLGGWSLGALIALNIARSAPHKVSRLVLIGASPCFAAREDWSHAMPAATLSEFRAAYTAEPEATLRRFVALQARGDAARRAVTATLTASLSPAAPASGLALLADTDLRAAIPHIAQPALLIHGAHDGLMPLAAAEWLASALPDARLEVFGDAAHAPFIAHAAEVARLITAFTNA